MACWGGRNNAVLLSLGILGMAANQIGAQGAAGVTKSSAADAEIAGSLVFTDETGKALPAGASWSPAKGKIYLTYTDDFKADLGVVFSFSVINRNNKASADAEAPAMAAPVLEGGRGVWRIAVPLNESPAPVKNNGIVETYFQGQVTVTVKSHASDGATDGLDVTAKLMVAYPDLPETISIKNAADPNAPVDRNTPGVIVQINDQDNSKLQDTVFARITCTRSGDYIYSFPLFQSAPGVLQSAVIPKAEGAAKSDAILQCLDADQIRVTYTDEVYGAKAEDSVFWLPNGVASLSFRDAKDTSIVIDSISDKYSNYFTVMAKVPNPTVGVVDTLQILFTPDDIFKDRLTLTLVETGPNTGVFLPREPVHYEFEDSLAGDFSTTDKKLELWWSSAELINSDMVQGKIALLGGKVNMVANLKVNSGYSTVETAYIKDLDSDGTGDHVYFVFPQKLDRLPASVTPLFWNQDGPAFLNKKEPILSFDPAGGQTVVIADFSAAPFGAGLTSIPLYGKPFATFPKGAEYKGQKPFIKDSIAPIILSAGAFAFDPGRPGKNQPKLAPDTVRVVVSEPLSNSNTADWLHGFRFAKAIGGACPDYSESQPALAGAVPSASPDSLTFTFLLPRSANPPLKGDCIYFNADGSVTDKVRLVPSKRAVVLGGRLPRKFASAYIKDLDGDGAGDHVYLTFDQKLDRLPISITPVSWNEEGGSFGNRLPPVLSFAPGSQTVVIADFSAAPFKSGLTSVPEGAFPHATLPDEDGLPGLEPEIADSIGPIPLHAVLIPIDPAEIFNHRPILAAETLRVAVSEPLNDAHSNGLLRYAKANPDSTCPDYSLSAALPSPVPPVPEPDGLTYTLLLDAAFQGVHGGDCIFLTADGTITDKPGNAPSKIGIPLASAAQRTVAYRGYPPIAGGNAAWLDYPLIAGAQGGVGDGFTQSNPAYQVPWIPPVFFNGIVHYDDKPMPALLSPSAGIDTKVTEELPRGLSTLEVVSAGRYQAEVEIYDNLGNFIRRFHQSFGYAGEMQNKVHRTNIGLISFLVWDATDHRGQHAGQGAYIWKVMFTFEDGKRTAAAIRTGLLRAP